MSTESNASLPGSPMAGPLDCNLMEMDTTRKVLQPDKMMLLVEKAEITPTRDGQGRYIKLTLKTTSTQRDQTGTPIDAGHYIFDQVMITVTGKATPQIVAQRVAELAQAARLSGDIRMTTVDMWHKQLEGKLLAAQVDYEPESNDNGKRYDAKNVIGRYLKQMKIVIETIPHDQQRYTTVGDWYYEGEGDARVLHIKVSKLSEKNREVLIAVHELIEVLLCEDAGITQAEVDHFETKVFSYEEHPDEEPGDSPIAPYRHQHCIATGIERLLAAELGVNWKEYEKELESLPEVTYKI